MELVSILLVDDHPVVRAGMKYMLRASPRLQIVGEAATGVEAVEKVRDCSPSVVLMDIEMPGMDGLQTTRRISQQFPQTHVVIMTMHDDDLCVADALQAGATGYLLKDAPREEICQVVEAAARGETTIKTSILHRAVRVIRSTEAGQQSRASTLLPHHDGGDLTSRERSVLRLLVEGKTNKEIGAELFVSTSTAKKHVENILGKLGARDRTDAAAIAIRLGLAE